MRRLYKVRLSDHQEPLVYDFTPIVNDANAQGLDASLVLADAFNILTNTFYMYGKMAAFSEIADDGIITPNRAVTADSLKLIKSTKKFEV